MKTILSDAINGIDWNNPDSIEYILQNKKNSESFLKDNILMYLTQVSELNFEQERLIDGVRGQKVDLIELSEDKDAKHFIIDPETKDQIPVGRLIDFGMNTVFQPAEYNINKTLSDIKRRTVTQGLKNEYFTVQIVLNIDKLQRINTAEQEKEVVKKLKKIDSDYTMLDPNHVKVELQMKQGENTIDIYFYICGSFSSDSWSNIKGLFNDYQTSKGKSLSILND